MIERWARRSLAHPHGARWPGPWRVRHPAYSEIFEAASDPTTRRLIVRGSTQSGKTELIMALAAYFAVEEHAPVLVYEATRALQSHVAERLRLLFAQAPHRELAEAYARPRPPFRRRFPGGGSIEILSSTAHDAFLSRSARVVLLDEVRAHPTSLILSAEGRQAAWSDKKPLTVAVSSAAPFLPCRISELLERSDFRLWRIPAPCCGTEIPIDWDGVDGYGADPAGAYLKCPSCGDPIPGPALKKALARGRFIPTKTPADPGSVGFHIPETINPHVPLAETARKFMSATVAQKNTGQTRELIDFHADAMAVTHADGAGVLDPEAVRVACRAPGYRPDDFLPAWVSLITGGVDVQGDRLEADFVGWGAVEVAVEGEASKFRLDRSGWTTWKVGSRFFRLLRAGICYSVFAGDPNTDGPWHALNEIRMKKWRVGGPAGPMLRPALCLVDSGGHHVERVRSWSRSNDASAAACKGSSRPGSPLHRLARTKSILQEFAKPLCFVGTDAAKDITLGCIRRATISGDRSWCWPDDGAAAGYDWRYFAGLVASERRVTTESPKTKHLTSRYFKLPGQANEPLDTSAYGLAALSVVGLTRLIENARILEGSHAHIRAAA